MGVTNWERPIDCLRPLPPDCIPGVVPSVAFGMKLVSPLCLCPLVCLWLDPLAAASQDAPRALPDAAWSNRQLALLVRGTEQERHPPPLPLIPRRPRGPRGRLSILDRMVFTMPVSVVTCIGSLVTALSLYNFVNLPEATQGALLWYLTTPLWSVWGHLFIANLLLWLLTWLIA